MITLLIIVLWIAVALIYAIQFQIVKDYQPIEVRKLWMVACDNETKVIQFGTVKLECYVLEKKYSIFDFKHIFRRYK